MKRVLFAVLVLVLISAPLAARGSRRKRAPKVDPELAKVVDPLIEKLDDPIFKVREAATIELMALGPKIRPALEAALEHPSAEVRLRIRRVLLHFEELERQARVGIPTEDDWPMLRHGPGRGGSAGLGAVREEPEVKWFRSLPWIVGEPYFDSPLLAAGGVLVAVNRNGHVVAVNQRTGAIEWEAETGEPVFASPVMAAGMIYVPGKSLVALDAEKGGKRVWSWPTDYGVVATPIVAGGLVYAVEKGEKLVALDPATGEQKWRFRMRATSSAPVVVGGLIIVGNEEGVVAIHAESGRRRWSFDTPGPVASAPVVLPDRVVVGDEARNLYALSVDRGKEIWHRRIPDGRLVETPAVYGDTVLFATSGLTFRALSAKDGSDRWTRWIGCITQSSPCIAGGLVYFTAGPELYALEITNGDDLWRMPLVGEFTSPICVAGKIYVLTLDGVVLCLE